MKLLDANFNPATGGSFAVVENKGEKFLGFAKCHPDDMAEASKFAGCGYAETRAIIKALKEERRKEKEQCEILRKFVKAVTQYKDFDNTSREARAMFRQLNRRIKKVNALTEEINKEMQNLEAAIAQRDIVKRAIKRRRDRRAEEINPTI